MPLNKKGKPCGDSTRLKNSQRYAPAFGRAIVGAWEQKPDKSEVKPDAQDDSMLWQDRGEESEAVGDLQDCKMGKGSGSHAEALWQDRV
jgi:hypothetical protein